MSRGPHESHEAERTRAEAQARAQAALAEAGIALPDAELVEVADGLRALDKLLAIVRASRAGR